MYFLMLFFISSLNIVHAEITITDSRGEQTFAESPKRVVVLNWDLLEQLLALEVTPLAAPNVIGYQQWVVRPTAPDSIEEIGTRSEPNLEKIAALNPDVIIAASPQQDLLPILESIAPVVYLSNFGKQEDAAPVAIKHFKTLATLFDKEALASQKLQQMDTRFTELRQQLEAKFFKYELAKDPVQKLPDVVVMRFSTPSSVFFYTENSTTQYVVNKLGLSNPLPFQDQPWGVIQRRINKLQYIEDGYVLYILPFPEEKKLKESVLWQAMPFVQNKHVHSVRSVWNYGGAMSLLYMAEAITDSLLEVAPE
ncbi:iron-siderophore ABC transporter substrate-binding protein [Photobacterium frigidiphilum]|nr:iron-siderophore ABC transporter substrate-binding protein [Photobacterium frigidiphilum]